MGLPQSATTPFLCLLGGPAAIHSPGMRVYNALFRRLHRPWSYITVISQQTAAALDLVRELGALGASVTMPHKAEAFRLSSPDATATTLRAVNTVRFEGDDTPSTNTDVEGIWGPLAEVVRQGSVPLRRMLILGGGGAAAAGIVAAQRLQLSVVVAARTKRIQQLKAQFADQIETVDWHQRGEVEADIVVNATPIGGHQSPWPTAAPIRAQLVFDLAIAKERSTLLRQAASSGAQTLPATEMWVHQGAAQLQWITGLAVRPESLREQLP